MRSSEVTMFVSVVFLLLAFLAITAPVTAAPSSSGTRPLLLLVVRQETSPALSHEALERIGSEVSKVWQDYVDVALQIGDASEPYRADDTLRLVLTDAQPSGPTAPGLGWIDFVNGQPSRTITVSVAAAKVLAVQGQWAGRSIDAWSPGLSELFLSRALGRAVAHEIGHYLLRSKQHTAQGLMRATFTAREIMNRGLSQYVLEPSEVALLEARTRSYALARRRYSDPSSSLTPGKSGSAASEDGDSNPSLR